MNILKNPELYLINLFDELQLYGETDQSRLIAINFAGQVITINRDYD